MIETFILTCAGGAMMPALVQQLRAMRPDRRIVGVDANPAVAPSGFDEVFCIPYAADPDFPRAVKAICRNFAPAILVPGSDEEAEALAPLAADFAEAGIVVNVSSSQAVAKMRDKYRTAQEAERAGCHVPKTIRIESFDELRRAAVALGYPKYAFVIKPIRGRGRRGTWFVSDDPARPEADVPETCQLAAIEGEIETWPGPMVACEMIAGRALTVDILCDQGMLVAAIVRQWAGRGRFPFQGQDIVDRPQLVGPLAALMERIAVHGLVDADFIEAADGRDYLLEINPRPSGSVAVTLAAGIPIYDVLADVLAGRPVSLTASPRRTHISGGDLTRTRPVQI